MGAVLDMGVVVVGTASLDELEATATREGDVAGDLPSASATSCSVTNDADRSSSASSSATRCSFSVSGGTAGPSGPAARPSRNALRPPRTRSALFPSLGRYADASSPSQMFSIVLWLGPLPPSKGAASRTIVRPLNVTGSL